MYYFCMETIHWSTRTVYLSEDKAIKLPRESLVEEGTIANSIEYANTLKFPSFSVKTLNYLHWILIIQERLSLFHEVCSKFKFYDDLRQKCISNPLWLSCNSFIRDLWDFDDEEFDFAFQWMLVSSFFKQAWFLREIKKFSRDVRHNLLLDSNYGVNKDSKIVLLDLWARNLDLVLQEYWKDIFSILNSSISLEIKW